MPNLWNNLDKNTRDYTNCYSYAFDRMEVNADKKLQPGELSTGKFNSYDCDEILNKLKMITIHLILYKFLKIINHHVIIIKLLW